MNDLASYKNERLQAIEAALLEATTLPSGCPNRLREAIRYSLLAPGKRLRPFFLLAATELCGGTYSKVLPAAAAIEMIHAYSLIHDDLPAMDDDQLRRGRATCHIQFDEATAILAGDALQALAFETLAQVETIPSRILSALRELAQAAGPCGMVGGQTDDVLVESGMATQDRQTLLERIHSRKTGALILASLRIGAYLAGATQKDLTALNRFGAAFGMAFQITDDLLDALGDSKTLGKNPQRDLENGKLTFVTLYGIEKSRVSAQEQIDLALTALQAFDSDHPAFQTLCEMTKSLSGRTF